jgi:hypothetical protein
MKVKTSLEIVLVTVLAVCCQNTTAQTSDIYGVVTDSLTRQRIPFANIVVVGTNRGAASNNVGFYLIPKLPPGTYEVSASVMGYARAFKKVTLKPEESTELSFQLRATAIEGQEVVVEGSRKLAETGAVTSVHVLDKQDIKLIPVAAQQDLLQALRILPGIVSTSDVSSRFYVRGGAGDQNLFLLDGMRVYYPFHALGIYSVFNPNLVDNVEVYTGAFPPGFGERLSSVVNVFTRDGRADRLSARTDLNFLSSGAEVEGPAFANSSWLFDLRKSFFSQTLSNIVGQPLPVSFYDGMFKLSAQPGGIQKFDLTVLSSGDNLLSSSMTDPDYHWNNNGFALSGSQLPTSRVFVQWMFYGSAYSAERDAKSSTSITSASTSVTHYGLRTTATIYTGPHDLYFFGFEFGVPSLSYRFFNRMGIPMDLRSSFIDFSGWARYQTQLERLQLDVGLHAELVPLFEGESMKTELQPRINLGYELNGGWKVKASYGRFTQRMLTVGNEDDIISIFEGWIRVPVNLPPEQADHYVIGFSRNPIPSVSINSEAYYKKYRSLVIYNWDKTNVTEPDYVQGSGASYGIEVMLRSSFSWIDFYGTYALSWAEINNQAMVYYPRYDRRHHLNLMVVGRPLKGVSATLRWEFGSGFPYSQSVGYIGRPSLEDELPGEFEYAEGTPYMLLGPKNAARLPAYQRLDASVSYDFRLIGLDVSLGADVLNVYDNKNIFYFDRVTGQQVNMLPFYPSASLTVRY